MSDLVLTPSVEDKGMELLKWCVQAGPHPNDDGWLLVFRFENNLQATVAYGANSNGLSVGVMAGDSLLQVWDWLEGVDVVDRLFEIMHRNALVDDAKKDGE